MWPNTDYADQSSAAPVGAPAGPPAPGAVQPGYDPSQYPLVPYAPPAPPPAAPAPAPVPASAASLGGSFDVPPTLMERIELCKFLAEANLLPQALRSAPANVLLIMHKALALNLPLSVAIEHLHVIDGKVGHSAELLRALLYRNGHVLRWLSKDDKEVVGELVLRHDPKHPRREKFNLRDATRMELTNKSNWKKDPESMLVARCTTRLVSRHCPEVAVALGNLSAIDFEDDTPDVVPADSSASTPPEDHAAALYREAREATDSQQLKDIGRRAKDAGLLEHQVEGDTTLQAALLQRINEISQAREAAEGKADKPAGRSPRGGGGGTG